MRFNLRFSSLCSFMGYYLLFIFFLFLTFRLWILCSPLLYNLLLVRKILRHLSESKNSIARKNRRCFWLISLGFHRIIFRNSLLLKIIVWMFWSPLMNFFFYLTLFFIQTCAVLYNFKTNLFNWKRIHLVENIWLFNIFVIFSTKN